MSLNVHFPARLLAGLLLLVLAAACLARTSPELRQATPAVDGQGLPNVPKDGDEVAVLTTDKGQVVIMFFPDTAPKHVANFLDLGKKGFYDGTRFHRCIAGFMVQGGDPNSKDLAQESMWGEGGYMENGVERNVKAEFNSIKHLRGIVSMARTPDPDSASSQFFIMVADSPHLDGKYSAFGKVVSGMDVLDTIVLTGDPNANGKVPANIAVVLKKVEIKKWPIQ